MAATGSEKTTPGQTEIQQSPPTKSKTLVLPEDMIAKPTLWKKKSAIIATEELMLLNCAVGEDS